MTEYVDLTPAPTAYPLASPVISMHLGLYECTERNWPTLLKRAIAFDEAIGGMFANDVAPDEAMARAHIGQRLGGSTWTDDQFAKHLRVMDAARAGGRATVSHHVRRHDLTPGVPIDIYVQLDENPHGDTEHRRVQVYADARTEAYWDGATDEGDEFEDGFADAPSVIDQRHGYSASVITDEEFQMIWDAAVSTRCPYVTAVSEAGGRSLCGTTRADGDPWCTEHMAIAAANFPRLLG